MSSEEIQDEPWVENEMEEVENYNDCKHMAYIAMRYKTALLANNYEQISYFRSLGGYVNQRISNAYEHEKAKLFGYDEIIISDNGWLEHTKFDHVDEIYFDGDVVCDTVIRLAMGRNGKWTNSISYMFGAGCGVGDPLTVHNDIFDSREEALETALQYLYGKFFEAQSIDGDTVNYNKKHIAKILKNVRTQMLLLGISPKIQMREQAKETEPTLSLFSQAKQKLFHAPQLSLFGDNVQLTF